MVVLVLFLFQSTCEDRVIEKLKTEYIVVSYLYQLLGLNKTFCVNMHIIEIILFYYYKIQ